MSALCACVCVCKSVSVYCCLTMVGESWPFSGTEAKMLYVYCSSHLMMMMMIIIIHSFHKRSLKPIKALVLLNSKSSSVFVLPCPTFIHLLLNMFNTDAKMTRFSRHNTLCLLRKRIKKKWLWLFNNCNHVI